MAIDKSGLLIFLVFAVTFPHGCVQTGVGIHAGTEDESVRRTWRWKTTWKNWIL